MNDIKIENKTIGTNHPCFIIAEGGVNHNGQLDLALKMIDIAAESGADAIKFQKFIAEDLVTTDSKMCDYQKDNTGKNESQLDMLKKLEFKEEYYPKVIARAKEKGIIIFFTPFDDKAIDFLEDLNVPAYKIGSSDTDNIPALIKMAKLNKPMIISSGMSDMKELKESVDEIKKYNKQVIAMQCTTDYPTPFDCVDLLAMNQIKKECDCIVGFSDHTPGVEVPIAAAALGAKIIEKHFTLDKNMDGPDHLASVDPKELKLMVNCIRNVEQSLGDGIKKVPKCSIKYLDEIKKSIISNADIKAGNTITKEMLIIKRPSYGIKPKEYFTLLGKTAKVDIKKDTCLKWKDFE